MELTKENFKDQFIYMDAIEIYKHVLSKKYINSFPPGFWDDVNSFEYARQCTRYAVEEILNLNDEELKKTSLSAIFTKNGLNNMVRKCYKGNYYKAIADAYSERNYKPWEFISAPKHLWDDINNAIEATRWLLEYRLKLKPEDFAEKLDTQVFHDNGLRGMLLARFNGSYIQAVQTSYPELDIQTWEFKNASMGIWLDIKNGIKATRWLFDTKLKIAKDEILSIANVQIFEDNGLLTMLEKCFNGSPFEAVITSYPELNIQPWEFKNAPLGIWLDIKNGIKATRWLVDIKLKIAKDDITTMVDSQTFFDNGLRSMLGTCFNGSYIKALIMSYPELNLKSSDFKFAKAEYSL